MPVVGDSVLSIVREAGAYHQSMWQRIDRHADEQGEADWKAQERRVGR